MGETNRRAESFMRLNKSHGGNSNYHVSLGTFYYCTTFLLVFWHICSSCSLLVSLWFGSCCVLAFHGDRTASHEVLAQSIISSDSQATCSLKYFQHPRIGTFSLPSPPGL